MPKKTITGKTKLSPDSTTDLSAAEPLKLLAKKSRLLPRSYRLKESDLERLRKIVEGINEISSSNFSETNIIRALIAIGVKLKSARIINAYREIL